MIMIGTDTRKRMHTSVAVVAGAGEHRGELTAAALSRGVAVRLAWADGVDRERIGAIENCRQVSGRLERFLRTPRLPPLNRHHDPSRTHKPYVELDMGASDRKIDECVSGRDIYGPSEEKSEP